MRAGFHGEAPREVLAGFRIAAIVLGRGAVGLELAFPPADPGAYDLLVRTFTGATPVARPEATADYDGIVLRFFTRGDEDTIVAWSNGEAATTVTVGSGFSGFPVGAFFEVRKSYAPRSPPAAAPLPGALPGLDVDEHSGYARITSLYGALFYESILNIMISGRQVLRARHSAGLTQAQLAARTGTSQAQISRVEKGLTAPPGLMARLAETLDLAYEAGIDATLPTTPGPLRPWQPSLTLAGPLPLSLTIETWQRSLPSGDFFVVQPFRADAVLVVAGDAAGHGIDAMSRATFIDGWLRGWTAAQPGAPSLTTLATALEDVRARTAAELALAACHIRRAGGAYDVEIVTFGYPAPFVLVGPRAETVVPTISQHQGRLGRVEGSGYRFTLSASWNLVFASDGLLQRLGAGDEQKGRRILRADLAERPQGEPLEVLLRARGVQEDDESMMVVAVDEWDLRGDIDTTSPSDVERALTDLAMLASRALEPSLVAHARQAAALAIENVHSHAHRREATIRARTTASGVRIEIIDDGPGVPTHAITASLGGIAAIMALAPATTISARYPHGTVVGISIEGRKEEP